MQLEEPAQAERRQREWQEIEAAAGQYLQHHQQQQQLLQQSKSAEDTAAAALAIGSGLGGGGRCPPPPSSSTACCRLHAGIHCHEEVSHSDTICPSAVRCFHILFSYDDPLAPSRRRSSEVSPCTISTAVAVLLQELATKCWPGNSATQR